MLLNIALPNPNVNLFSITVRILNFLKLSPWENTTAYDSCARHRGHIMLLWSENLFCQTSKTYRALNLCELTIRMHDMLFTVLFWSLGPSQRAESLVYGSFAWSENCVQFSPLVPKCVRLFSCRTFLCKTFLSNFISLSLFISLIFLSNYTMHQYKMAVSLQRCFT